MNMLNLPELTGRQVTLIPLREEHIDELFLTCQDEQIWTYLPSSVHTKEDMAEIVERALIDKREGIDFPYAIREHATNQLIGSTRYLDYSAANRHVEIGWTWLAPRVWRTAINTECKYLLLRHGFETLGMVRVQLKTDARNVRSQQAIARIGATKEGILRKHRILHDGYIRDTVYYSIIDEEWPDRKRHLEAMMSAY
ncbi:GNAT family acetyltransferase [Ferroacidibacillus organovorans]|uniref:GNAT family acetyltransferase n=2 Tax=Ferroacidibacillus organovorans TaxID=1765683 RepID=A0A853KF00_9BACL|nr:GNAT family acetyltransferase [Ferroacidibacillus organovorans]OAG94898.1 GNAT family acetyltransferase [Ferroacidibacillus organovorans]